jgi:hypothetical protein
MDFPATVKTYHEIWSSDFNKYIQETFKTSYHYADTMDYPSQDTYHIYHIGNHSCGDAYCWDEELFREIPFDLERLFQNLHNGLPHERPSPSDLLEGLYQMGMIPEGHYLFTVWW